MRQQLVGRSQCLSSRTSPEGPCTQIVDTLAPKYPNRDYLKAKVYTTWVHGPSGKAASGMSDLGGLGGIPSAPLMEPLRSFIGGFEKIGGLGFEVQGFRYLGFGICKGFRGSRV